MIDKNQMMELLLGACPSFWPDWQAFHQEYADLSDDLPLYVALADYVRHLIALLEQQRVDRFSAVFGVVERLHADGDEYVRNAAMAGILEFIENTNFHTTTHPNDFLPYFGPESRRWWDEWSDFR